MSRIRFSKLAEIDLEGIGDTIAQDNPSRAISFLAELRDQCSKISMTPLAYRARPELVEGLRSCAYGSYVIFFKPRDTDVVIVRVLHGARDIQVPFGE